MQKISFPLFLSIILIAYLLFGNSCANPGSPQGGPKDSIPPTIISMIPQNLQKEFTSKEISIDFDEYVVSDDLSSKLVISPPLSEKPTIKNKGKSISIIFNEDLLPNRTYSIDLKNGIKDYNEGNKIENLRLIFSTYDQIDTLRIEGHIVDAFTHEPVENTTVTLYTIYDDSVFTTTRPDFIAMTNDSGYFLFDNLPEQPYRLYALVDGNKDLFYSMDAEQIAFYDSVITPGVEFISKTDTIISNGDTTVSDSYAKYYPQPINTFLFTEDRYNPFLLDYSRPNNDKIIFTFNESATDSFHFELLDYNAPQLYSEHSTNNDTITYWFIDTTLINIDTLMAAVRYTILDTLSIPTMQTDTIELTFKSKENNNSKPKRKGGASAPPPPPPTNEQKTFTFNSNIKTSGFDLNVPIIVEAPSPVVEINDSIFKLQLVVNDSTFTPVKTNIEQISERKYKIGFEHLPETSYIFTIDSANVNTLSGLSNLEFNSKFKTQKEDFYGTLIFNVTGFTDNAIIQLLGNSKDELIVKSIELDKNKNTATFNFLKAGKYRAKLFLDKNNNGKWDTGKLKTHTQPEPVFYLNKVLTAKANWELKEDWIINEMNFELKNITDPDKKNEKNQQGKPSSK